MEKSALRVYGEVLQKVDDGILVKLGTDIYFLEGHPRYKDLADGDFVGVLIKEKPAIWLKMYQIGIYEYVAVGGIKKTIRKCTCDLEQAILYRKSNASPKP